VERRREEVEGVVEGANGHFRRGEEDGPEQSYVFSEEEREYLQPSARVTQRNTVHWEQQKLGIVCFVWVMVILGVLIFTLRLK